MSNKRVEYQTKQMLTMMGKLAFWNEPKGRGHSRSGALFVVLGIQYSFARPRKQAEHPVATIRHDENSKHT
jgi:hypothetical protein